MLEIINFRTLTLCRVMDFSLKFDTVKPGWSIVTYHRVTGYNFQKYCVFSLKINFFTANSTDPDKTPCSVAFPQGVYCL